MFKTMGRLLLLALVVLSVALLWRAFGPGSAERYGSLRGGPQPGQKPQNDKGGKKKNKNKGKKGGKR